MLDPGIGSEASISYKMEYTFSHIAFSLCISQSFDNMELAFKFDFLRENF